MNDQEFQILVEKLEADSLSQELRLVELIASFVISNYSCRYEFVIQELELPSNYSLWTVENLTNFLSHPQLEMCLPSMYKTTAEILLRHTHQNILIDVDDWVAIVRNLYIDDSEIVDDLARAFPNQAHDAVASTIDPTEKDFDSADETTAERAIFEMTNRVAAEIQRRIAEAD